MGNPVPNKADFNTNHTRTIQEIGAKLLQLNLASYENEAHCTACAIVDELQNGITTQALRQVISGHHLLLYPPNSDVRVKELVQWLLGEEKKQAQETPPFVFGTMRCLLEPGEQFRLHGLMLRNDSNEAMDFRRVLDLLDEIPACAESSRWGIEGTETETLPCGVHCLVLELRPAHWRGP